MLSPTPSRNSFKRKIESVSHDKFGYSNFCTAWILVNPNLIRKLSEQGEIFWIKCMFHDRTRMHQKLGQQTFMLNLTTLNQTTKDVFHRIGTLGRFNQVVAMSVCLCVCVFDVPFHVVHFEAYLAPTSQSRMSKIFRDWESLGKSAGNKWYQNWTFFLESGLKLPL